MIMYTPSCWEERYHVNSSQDILTGLKFEVVIHLNVTFLIWSLAKYHQSSSWCESKGTIWSYGYLKLFHNKELLSYPQVLISTSES